MARKRYTEVQIAGVLKEAEAVTRVPELFREHGIGTCFSSLGTQLAPLPLPHQ